MCVVAFRIYRDSEKCKSLSGSLVALRKLDIYFRFTSSYVPKFVQRDESRSRASWQRRPVYFNRYLEVDIAKIVGDLPEFTRIVTMVAPFVNHIPQRLSARVTDGGDVERNIIVVGRWQEVVEFTFVIDDDVEKTEEIWLGLWDLINIRSSTMRRRIVCYRDINISTNKIRRELLGITSLYK